MKRLLGLMLLIFLSSSFMGVAYAAVQQVRNGGFETGNFSGWSYGAPEPFDPPTVVGTSHHTGHYSAMFKTWAYIEQTYSTPFTPSSDLTFWESRSGDLGILTVKVTYSDSSTSTGTGIPGATLPWKQYTFPVNHAKKISKIRFECQTGETMGVYLDDVSILSSSSVTLFSDGFETGNFNKWTGTSVSPGETRSIVTNLKHDGAYSAKFTSNGGGVVEYAYSYKTITSSTELYARAYFYVSASGIVENSDSFTLIGFFAGGNNVAYAGWRKNNGVVKWFLSIKSGANNLLQYSTATPLTNRWYSVELHWKKSSTAGQGDLYINGVKACSITGKNTAYYGNANSIRFGLPTIINCGPTTVYGDTLKVSNSYI